MAMAHKEAPHTECTGLEEALDLHYVDRCLREEKFISKKACFRSCN